jgi:ClpP class serine protease
VCFVAHKEVSQEDLMKAKDEIEEMWKLFKDFVSEQHPTLNVDTVATGESWYGKRAIELGLCDALQTAYDVLIGFMNQEYDAYHVKYMEPVTDFLGHIMGFKIGLTSMDDNAGLSGWFLKKIAAQLLVEFERIRRQTCS